MAVKQIYHFSLILALSTLQAVAERPTAAGETTPVVRRSLERLEEMNSSWSAEWDLPSALRAVRAASTSARPAAQQMQRSEDPELRKRAIEALSHGTALPTLSEFLWALGDEDPGVRAVAVERIKGLSPAALLQQVLDVLVANQEADVRALDAALPELAPVLGDEFLRMYRDKELPIPLRRAAAYSLGKMRIMSGAADLAKGAWESELTLATSSALALFALRDTQSVRAWAALRKHPEYSLRWLSVRALTELGGREAFAALAEIAYGQAEFDSGLDAAAIDGLAAWPFGDSVPALIEVVKRNPGFSHVAAQRLRVKTGQNLGTNVAAWEDWYRNGPAPTPEATPTTGQESFDAQELLGHAQFVPPALRGAF